MSNGTILPRRIKNPVQGDVAVFLETSAESGGERSLLALEVEPGGHVTPHLHMTYAEHFVVREGRLTVTVGGVRHELGPGEEALVDPGALHAWSNETSERAVADIELRPGQPGFERTLRVAYGLAADGRTRPDGVPRNPLYTALLLDWAEMRLPGVQGALAPVMRALARFARLAGIERELQRRYL